MAKCGVCGAPSPLFLCRNDQTDLRDTLHGLAHGMRHPNGQYSPGWLELLADAAIGRTRLTDDGGSGGRREPFKGDDHVPITDAETLRKQFLAAGGVNARASKLLAEARVTLTDCVEHTATVIGIKYRSLDQFDLGAMALWLGHNVKGIARSPRAGEIHAHVKKIVDAIEPAINRPPAPKTCGPCPTKGYDTEKGFVTADVSTLCGTRLEARPDAVEVRCPKCKKTHNVNRLVNQLNEELNGKSFTIRQLTDLVLPRADEYVPRSTLYNWAGKGLLNATGYDHLGQPKYLLADVRQLRSTVKRKASAR